MQTHAHDQPGSVDPARPEQVIAAAKDIGGEVPIEEMVRAHAGGRSWEENPKAVVKMQNGLLVVKNTPEVHKQVRRLLDLLRANK